jgi:hypothetical protein
MFSPSGISRIVVVIASIAFAAIPATRSAEAAGALAYGKCGAYGYSFDHAKSGEAQAAAKAKCQGACMVVTMNRACAAFSIDLKNPCGAYGYAVAAKISGALNAASRRCHENGGKECVIRAWACDARG